MPMLIAPLVEFALTAALGEVAATGAIAGVSGLTLTGIVATGIVVGGAIGAEMLLKPHRAPTYSPWQPQMPVATTVSAQSIGPRFHTFGILRVGGVYHFREVFAPNLLYGIVINCAPIDSIVSWYVDDELQVPAAIALGSVISADNLIFAPTTGMKLTQHYIQVYYGGVWSNVPTGVAPVGFYEFRNGKPGGNISEILKTYAVVTSGGLLGGGGGGGPSTIWDTSRLCCNLACIYSAWATQTSTNPLGAFPNRFPQHSTVIRGETVFDPRDPTQNFADVSTWKFSRVGVPDPGRNPALQWARYWTHEDGGRLGYADMDWTSIAQAANDCDRTVPAYGGTTEPFAQSAVQWHAGEAPADVEARILGACDGQPYEANGKQALWIAQAVVPTITLTAADISSITWDETTGAMDETNYVQASYSEPRANYAFIATSPVTNSSSIAAVGERAQTVELKAVTSHSQAYRLAYRVLRRQNPPLKVTLIGGPRALRALNEFAININAPEYGVSGIFRPMDLFDVATDFSRCTVQFGQIADDTYADVVPPDDPVSPDLGGLSGVALSVPTPVPTTVPLAISWSGGGSPVPTLVADAWTYQVPAGTAATGRETQGEPIDTTLRYYTQSRPVDPVTHVPTGPDWSFWSPLTQWTNQSPSLSVSTTYEVRAWFVSSLNGIPGAFSASVFYAVPAHP